MAITQSQFITSGEFSGIGAAKEDFVTSNKLPRLEKLLASFALKVIKDAQRNLKKANTIDTGNINQIVFEVEQNGVSFSVTIGYYANNPASKYFDFINKGVKGLEGTQNTPYKFKTKYASKKMVDAILKWVKHNNIQPTETKKLSKIERKRKSIRAMVQKAKDSKVTMRQLATGIAIGIKKKGIKSTHYFDDALKQLQDKQFKEKLQKIVKEEINISIQSTWLNK
jgi:hypothetical protein